MNNFIVRFSNGKYMNWTGGDTSYLEEAMMYDTKDEASRWGAEKAKGRGVKVLKLDIDLDKGDYKMTEANPGGGRTLLIRKKDGAGDYCVVVKHGSKIEQEYHTPDLADANGTANHILKSQSGILDMRAAWTKTRRNCGGRNPGGAGWKAKMRLYWRRHKRKRERAAKERASKGTRNPRGSFKALRRKLKRRGARTPGALAAWIGRKKYGKKRFAKMSAAGRRKRRTRRNTGKKDLGKSALKWVAGALGFIVLERVVKSYLKDHKELKA